MQTLARKRDGNRDASNEVQAFRQALDKSYEQMRERAGREWFRRYTGDDPSDTCVDVHIEDSEQHTLEV